MDVLIRDYSDFRDVYDAIIKTDEPLRYKIELSGKILKSKISERDLKEIIGFLLRST